MDAKEFFGKYAEQYAKSDSHARGSDLELLLKLISPEIGHAALDLATGTGFTAVALAKRVKHVVALDKTEEMLEQGKMFAEKENVGNIEFVVGDVEQIPFEAGKFDIVTARRATHHFPDKKKFLDEAMRVLKPGGMLGISDMVSPEGDEGDGFNTLERFRDHSHVGAETLSSFKALIKGAGFNVTEAVGTEERVTFEKWLYPVPVESDEGKQCIEFLKSSTPEFKKLIGYMEEGNSFIKRRAVIAAQKPI